MAKSWFPKPVGPRAALSDLTALIFQQHRRHRLVFLTLSIGITSLIVTGFGRGEAGDAEGAEAVALNVVEEPELVLGIGLPREASVVVLPRTIESGGP